MAKAVGKSPLPPTSKPTSGKREGGLGSGDDQRAAAGAERRVGGFLATTRLKKAGGSLVMTMPAPARKLLNLTEGQEMAVSVEGTKVIVEAASTRRVVGARQPKYTLDQLVAGMTPDDARTDEERSWMDAPPAGREIW
jgi:antitoxin ChpS